MRLPVERPGRDWGRLYELLRTRTRLVSGWSKKLNATLSVDLLCRVQIQVSKRNLAGLPLAEDPKRLPDNSVVLNLDAMAVTEDQHSRGWRFRYGDDLCLLRRLLFLPEHFYFVSKPLDLRPKLGIGLILYRCSLLFCGVGLRSVRPENWRRPDHRRSEKCLLAQEWIEEGPKAAAREKEMMAMMMKPRIDDESGTG